MRRACPTQSSRMTQACTLCTTELLEIFYILLEPLDYLVCFATATLPYLTLWAVLQYQVVCFLVDPLHLRADLQFRIVCHFYISPVSLFFAILSLRPLLHVDLSGFCTSSVRSSGHSLEGFFVVGSVTLFYHPFLKRRIEAFWTCLPLIALFATPPPRRPTQHSRLRFTLPFPLCTLSVY